MNVNKQLLKEYINYMLENSSLIEDEEIHPSETNWIILSLVSLG